MTTIQGSLTHGDWLEQETITFPRSGDPPAAGTPVAGPGANGEEAVGGGAAAESLPLMPAWQLMVEPSAVFDLGDQIRTMQENPAYRSAALLRALERAREQLEGLESYVPLDQPLTINAADLAVMVMQLLSRLR